MLRKRKLENTSSISLVPLVGNAHKTKKPVIKLHRICSKNSKTTNPPRSIKSFFSPIKHLGDENHNPNSISSHIHSPMKLLKFGSFGDHRNNNRSQIMINSSITHLDTFTTNADDNDFDEIDYDSINELSPECGKCHLLPLEKELKYFSICNHCRTNYCSQCSEKSIYKCCNCDAKECEQCVGFDEQNNFPLSVDDDDEFSRAFNNCCHVMTRKEHDLYSFNHQPQSANAVNEEREQLYNDENENSKHYLCSQCNNI